MGAGDIVAIITGALVLLGVVYTFANEVVTAKARLSALEERTNTIWKFLMRRAERVALKRGYMEKNSPLRSTNEMMAAYERAGLIDRLHEIRRSNPDASRLDLMLLIENHLGEKLIDSVCDELDLATGECLVIAADIAMGLAA